MDGFYLMKNTTLEENQNLTFCVPDCRQANPAYVNNPLTGKCESKFKFYKQSNFHIQTVETAVQHVASNMGEKFDQEQILQL